MKEKSNRFYVLFSTAIFFALMLLWFILCTLCCFSGWVYYIGYLCIIVLYGGIIGSIYEKENKE